MTHTAEVFAVLVNRLLGADTQPKAAASRHGLRAGQRQR
jgi:hypothetical protein